MAPKVKVFKVAFKHKPGVPGLAYIEAFSLLHALDRAKLFAPEREVEGCTDLTDIIVLVPYFVPEFHQHEASDATR